MVKNGTLVLARKEQLFFGFVYSMGIDACRCTAPISFSTGITQDW